MGRAFDAAEDNPGGPRVVLLSHGLWQRLGRDSTIVGMTVRLDGYRYTVIGVLPRRFDFADAEILVPLRLDPADPGSRGAHYLAAVGRLAPGVSFARATADLDALSSRLRADNPANYTEDMQWRLVARPLRDAIVGNAGEALGLLSAAVVLVMIVACANVANLLLARTQRREPELALRTALGAGRSRIARQLITEGLILAVAGALLGVGLAVAGTNALLALAPGAIPRAERLSVDAGLLLTALVIGCGSAVFFSLAPALRATGMAGRSPGQLWSDAGRVIDSGGRRGGLRGFMHLLIGVETGLAVVVMIVAGLLVQSYARLAGEDVGLSPEGVLAFDITLPTEGYAVPAGRIAFFRQLTSRLEQLPGVERAGGVLSLPLRSGTGNIDIELEGRPVAPGASAPSPLFQVVTPGYFETVRVPLVLGRLPAASDDEGAPLVAWVNQTAARRLWHDESPIGRRFRFRGDSGDTWFTVAGVVGDVRTLAVAREPIWEYYVAHAQLPRVLDAADFHRGLSIVARVTGDPAALAGPLWRILAELDAGVAAAQVEPMTAVVARSISRSRLVSVLLSGFAALAGVLAAIGVYGVLSYGVSRRTREIGVRIALGATPARVVRAVTRQAVGAAGLGLLAGSLAALAVTRVLHNQLYDTGPRDPLVFGAAVFALGTVSALSALLPARRAARVPPAVALRDA
jgi:predicted permease